MSEPRPAPCALLATPAYVHIRQVGSVDFSDASALAAWQAARAALRAQRPSDGLAAWFAAAPGPMPQPPHALPFLRRASHALPKLVDATRAGDLHAALRAALPLVGAGPGLTPSWDDLLMGYLCGLQSCALHEDGAHRRFIAGFGKAFAGAGEGTTQASREWIARTAAQEGPPWLLKVLAAIAKGDAGLSSRYAVQALGVGHTSGAEGLLGVLLGSAVWQAGGHADELMASLWDPDLPLSTHSACMRQAP